MNSAAFALDPAFDLVPVCVGCSRLWLLVLMLGLIGFSLGMTALPTFPEIISSA